MTIAPTAGGVRVELARGYEDVAALRGMWGELEGRSITTDFDYFHTVLESELTSGVQAIQRTPRGWFGGADPRREGAVRGE